MNSPLKRHADLHLADVLSEEVMAAPASDLLAEAAEDFGDRRALAKEFDKAFARAVAQTRIRRFDRVKELALHTFTLLSWRMATAAVGGLIVVLSVATLYLEQVANPSAPAERGKDVAVVGDDLPTVSASMRDSDEIEAQRLIKAIGGILEDAARYRSEARNLPSASDFLGKPVWVETREDHEQRVRELLDTALSFATDVPVVHLQRKIEGARKNIREVDDRIVRLVERQLVAPKDGQLPGVLTETADSLGKAIDEARKRIALSRDEIRQTKGEVQRALKKSGVELATDQVDPLLDGVLSGDVVRLFAAFNSAKLIDAQLGKLLVASGENIDAARKYFAMHAAVLALLVHTQDGVIAKIDGLYLPKLSVVEADLRAAAEKTAGLLRAENRVDQKRALEGERASQRLAEEAAKGYRGYLLEQREQVVRARERTAHDLGIADDKSAIVEASFRLRELMRGASGAFEAIQRLEAPTFAQIFKNEELRREFESLTLKLGEPTG